MCGPSRRLRQVGRNGDCEVEGGERGKGLKSVVNRSRRRSLVDGAGHDLASSREARQRAEGRPSKTTRSGGSTNAPREKNSRRRCRNERRTKKTVPCVAVLLPRPMPSLQSQLQTLADTFAGAVLEALRRCVAGGFPGRPRNAGRASRVGDQGPAQGVGARRDARGGEVVDVAAVAGGRARPHGAARGQGRLGSACAAGATSKWRGHTKARSRPRETRATGFVPYRFVNYSWTNSALAQVEKFALDAV